MNNKWEKPYLIIIVAIIIVALCSCVKGSSGMTNILQEDLAGNLISGGYITLYNGIYYYSNDDYRKLYQMDSNFENKEELSTQMSSFRYIQFFENKLFYQAYDPVIPDGKSDYSYLIWSYDLKKGTESKLTSSDISVNRFNIFDGKIFFTTWWERIIANGVVVDNGIYGGQIYRMNMDGSGLTLLGDFKDDKYIQIANGKIYLSGCYDPVLITMDLDGSNVESQKLDRVFALSDLLVYKENIYFTVIDKDPAQPEENGGIQNPLASGLYKRSLSDSSAEPALVVEGDIPTFTISENKIYYAIYNETEGHQKIYQTDLDGNNPQYLTSGIKPIVLGNYLFYGPNDSPDSIAWVELK